MQWWSAIIASCVLLFSLPAITALLQTICCFENTCWYKFWQTNAWCCFIFLTHFVPLLFQVHHKSLSLGEVLDGDRMAESLYHIQFKENAEKKTLCKLTLSEKQVAVHALCILSHMLPRIWCLSLCFVAAETKNVGFDMDLVKTHLYVLCVSGGPASWSHWGAVLLWICPGRYSNLGICGIHRGERLPASQPQGKAVCFVFQFLLLSFPYIYICDIIALENKLYLWVIYNNISKR